MNGNSIYDSLSIDSIINEIRLTLSANPNAPFVILEGFDDIIFFQHHCLQDVIIRESFKGKLGVYEILGIFSDKKSVIGICDRDYDDAPLPENIFAYDFSCLETMIIANNRTMLTVFTQLDLCRNISLEVILNQLCWLSFLRKMSFQENWAIKFDGLPISTLFNCNYGLNKDRLINKLIEINDNPSLLSTERLQLIERAANANHTIDDLCLITQGHDLLSLIQCYHAHYIHFKGRTMSEGDIRALLYCTYAEKFPTSRIYGDISNYGCSVDITFWAT